MKFEMGIGRTLLRFGLAIICVKFWQRMCLHFPHALRLYEAEFKSIRLINLAEEISRQLNIRL
jgi:hypothetical protein